MLTGNHMLFGYGCRSVDGGRDLVSKLARLAGPILASPFSRTYRFLPKQKARLVPASLRAVSLESLDTSQR